MPLWPLPTWWDESQEVIHFVAPLSVGDPLDLSNGDIINLGGMLTQEEPSNIVDSPHMSCSYDYIFIVSQVSVESARQD